MAKFNAQKCGQWQKRLERFEASGLTVLQFCRDEEVSAHTFYYWAKRLRPDSGRRRRCKSAPSSATTAGKTPAEQSSAAMTGTDSSQSVHITCGPDFQVSVPSDCLEAIRCVLEWAGRRGAEPGNAASGFREVILAQSGGDS